nr:hypothetical protein [Tanacetum cinerariifolium]
KRKDTQVPQLSMPTESAVDEAINDEICDSLGNKLLDDEVLDKEDTSKQRRIDEVDADKDITLVQDKGKGKAKLIEEPEMPKKRKHQIRADKELAEKLQAEMQAEIDEEDRLAREKDQKEQEVNDALINT